MKFALLFVLTGFMSLGLADQKTYELSLTDINGQQQTLSQYRGKWVIINYWSTTCPPCVKEMPELSAFHKQHKDKDAVVIGVNFEDISIIWIKEFFNRVAVDYPIWLAGASPFTPFGKIIALPTTFIITPDGQVAGRHTGAITKQALDIFIKENK